MGFVDLQRMDSYLELQIGQSCPTWDSNQCLARPKDWKADIFQSVIRSEERLRFKGNVIFSCTLYILVEDGNVIFTCTLYILVEDGNVIFTCTLSYNSDTQ